MALWGEYNRVNWTTGVHVGLALWTNWAGSQTPAAWVLLEGKGGGLLIGLVHTYYLQQCAVIVHVETVL